jgi:hypothetical protein
VIGELNKVVPIATAQDRPSTVIRRQRVSGGRIETGAGDKPRAALGNKREEWGSDYRTIGAKSVISTAALLRSKTFPPLKYIVQNVIVEGCVLLAGKPKVGKSWLALDVALAVACGNYCLGERKAEVGKVLYLALEDGERRLSRRIDKLLPTSGVEWPENFQYATSWPRADQGGVEKIEHWCEENPDVRLIVIDILARFRTPCTTKTNAYEHDYAALFKLQELATRKVITILVLHHTRKGVSEDPVEEISGTLALSGAADAFLVLKRTVAGGTLIGRSRDTEDVDLAVQFSRASCRWTILGAAEEVESSDQRGRVLAALGEADEPMAVKEIMVAAGLKNRNAADLLLFKMRHVGAVERVKRGLYCVPGQFKTDRQKERLPTQVSAKTQQTSNLSDLSDPSGPPRTAGPQSACTIE